MGIDDMRISRSKYYPLYIGFRFWKWFIDFHIREKELVEHECLNQVMEGDYDCEYCNPKDEKIK